MKKLGEAIGRFVVKYKLFIVVASLLLCIPSIFGYLNTKINYDILVYLPKDIETMKGQDIYYQGKTKASLPISMKVTYKLDGQKMKLKEMLGKKGKVEIKIDYTNNETKTVDGKELYVPFVVTTGTMLLMLKLQMEKSSVMAHQILSWRLQHQVYQKTTIIIKI